MHLITDIDTTSERLTVGSARASAALSLDIGAEQRSGLTLLKRQNSGHSHRIPLLRANGELVPANVFFRLVQSSTETNWKDVVVEQHQIPSGEWPDLMYKQHVVAVNVGRTINCEHKDGGTDYRRNNDQP